MPAPVSVNAVLWVAQRPAAELVAQASRGPASPADIRQALEGILWRRLVATLKDRISITAPELDSRLSVADAVRVVLLRRIGGEAARQEREQSPMDRMNNLLRVMTGGPDKSAQRMDAANEAALRSERLRSASAPGSPESARLDALRAQADAFIRAQHLLIGKP